MEEKLYELMVQAEDIQKHAVKLQQNAQETFSALPLAVEQAGQKIRSTGLQMALLLLAIGIVICGSSVAFIGWNTNHLREEREALKATIQAEKATLAELQSKTWGLVLVDWGKDGRGIILPKGVSFVRSGPIKDGREAIVIKP